LLGALLFPVNILIVGARWWLLLRRLNVETMSLGYAMAATYASVFVGQATPGPIGADAVRGWLCYRRKVPLRAIVMSLLTDRLLGMLALIVVAGRGLVLAIRRGQAKPRPRGCRARRAGRGGGGWLRCG
jgi:uncharacterized membrane protein YbhN (UPF0104 family)